MGLASAASDLRLWIAAGIAAGLAAGDVGPAGPHVLILGLMALMCLSLDRIDLEPGDFSRSRGRILFAAFCCYVVSPAATLVAGRLLTPDALQAGWAMVAAMPCAVAVVSTTMVLGGDTKLSMLSLTSVYVLALAASPLMSFALIGSAVDPLEILKYIVLFIAVPLLVSRILRRVEIPDAARMCGINACFFAMLFVTFGTVRGYILGEPGAVLAVAAACLARVPLVHVAVDLLLRRAGVPAADRAVYVMQAYWKNTGLAMSMCLLLFPSNPEMALPGAISLPIELVYILVMMRWYRGAGGGADGLPAH